MASAIPHDPHASIRVLRHGPAPAAARRTLIMIHGRGADGADMLGLAQALALDDVACLAPEANGRTWYPQTFLAPLEQNEPFLSSALRAIASLVTGLGTDGVPPDRIGLLGFSQGACLSLEFAARHPRRFAAVVALSGGLIGPPGTPREYGGSLDGTPAFIGCSDIDAHIPVERVHESAAVFRRMGAVVDERIYPGMGHTVNQDELDAVRMLLTLKNSPPTFFLRFS
jgi:predicted esterase